jgi:hypothetical protein
VRTAHIASARNFYEYAVCGINTHFFMPFLLFFLAIVVVIRETLVAVNDNIHIRRSDFSQTIVQEERAGNVIDIAPVPATTVDFQLPFAFIRLEIVLDSTAQDAFRVTDLLRIVAKLNQCALRCG